MTILKHPASEAIFVSEHVQDRAAGWNATGWGGHSRGSSSIIALRISLFANMTWRVEMLGSHRDSKGGHQQLRM